MILIIVKVKTSRQCMRVSKVRLRPSLEICWLKGDKSISRQGFPIKRDGFDGNDENACWEECTGREGADAAYCEGKILGVTC